MTREPTILGWTDGGRAERFEEAQHELREAGFCRTQALYIASALESLGEGLRRLHEAVHGRSAH